MKSLNGGNECLLLPIRLRQEQLKKQLAQEKQQQEAKAQQVKDKGKIEEDLHRLKEEKDRLKKEEQDKEQQTQVGKEARRHYKANVFALLLYILGSDCWLFPVKIVFL